MSKRFLTIAATVFTLGLIAGAYLVLRTTVTSGELTSSTPLAQGKSSDELLTELLKLNAEEKENQNAYVPPEEKNVTDEFLSTVILSAGLTNTSAQKIQSSDFLVETVMPYLKSSEIDLFPIIPTSVLKLSESPSVNYKKYFGTTDQEVEKILKTMANLLDTDLEKLSDPETQNALAVYSKSLESSFENLSKTEIPPKYLDLHKNLMISVLSAKKIAEVMTNESEDPLKALMTLGRIDQATAFWQQTLGDYAKASTARK